jgi:UDP-glucose 4-epimerase
MGGQALRIHVTGGAGFIGSHLADLLVSQGHRVLVVDNLSTGRMANVEHLLAEDRFRFFEDTILNESLTDDLVAGVDQVYHLAAAVGVKHIVDDPVGCIRTNVIGTSLVLHEAAAHGKRTVIASSSEVHGKSTEVPLAEDSDCLLGPPTVRLWSYALSKAIDEQLALAYSRDGLEVSIVRFFNAFGPRLDARGCGSVVARSIVQAQQGRPITVNGDGQQTRFFTYVGDTVRGTLLGGTVPDVAGKVFNIGSVREISVNKSAETIRDHLGSGSEITHQRFRRAFGDGLEETRRRVPDVHRAAELLGFRAEVPLDEGLRKAISWFGHVEPHNTIDNTGPS